MFIGRRGLGEVVEADGGGDGDVERIGADVHGDGDFRIADVGDG